MAALFRKAAINHLPSHFVSAAILIKKELEPEVFVPRLQFWIHGTKKSAEIALDGVNFADRVRNKN